jgi:hypothetical protein
MVRFTRARRGAWLRRMRATSLAAVGATLALLAPSWLHAQTDYFNTDGGRPLRIQDANAVEWRAIELQFAPLLLERSGGGRWRPEIEPELAFGILPRTVLSFGFPLVSADRVVAPLPPSAALAQHRSVNSVGSTTFAPDVIGPGGESPASGAGQVGGLAGVHVSLFHQLNVETRLPSFAIKADAILPAGPFAADQPYYTLTGIVTRTLSALGPVRVHGNAAVTMGEGVRGDTLSRSLVLPAPRWRAGVSMDRAFPLQSTLIAVEALAQRSLLEDADIVWSTGAGVRHQFSPRVVVDVGVLRDLTGPERNWSFTVGSAVALSLGRRLF